MKKNNEKATNVGSSRIFLDPTWSLLEVHPRLRVLRPRARKLEIAARHAQLPHGRLPRGAPGCGARLWRLQWAGGPKLHGTAAGGLRDLAGGGTLS